MTETVNRRTPLLRRFRGPQGRTARLRAVETSRSISQAPAVSIRRLWR